MGYDNDDYYYEQQLRDEQRRQLQQQQELDRLRWSQEQQDRELDYAAANDYAQDYDFGRDPWSDIDVAY